MNIDDEEWETEARRRIHILLCSIYHRKKISLSQAQGILGDLDDADDVLKMMKEKKWIMPHENEFEFTFAGLKEFMQARCNETGITDPGKLVIHTIKEAARKSI